MRLHAFNKVKIIATLGPSSNTLNMVRALIRAGVDCFRLNFSHGDGPALTPLITMVREASRLEGATIPILGDIQGPKLRIGKMPIEGVTLTEGAPFVLTSRLVEGSETEVHSPYEFLTKDITANARILLADGSIELTAERIDATDVHCRVVTGGRLYSNKGLNLPGTRLSVEALTAKDHRDLAFVAESDIDIVAISFVRTPQDLAVARSLLVRRGRIPVVAKLERPEALDHLDAILEASDGVMVARGDLGVEMPFERVPILQKQILQRAGERAKWAVVATQMLGSMVLNSRPSRAEVSDVANAVIDGADAIMLSEETATGRKPVAAVEAMVRIAREAETSVHQNTAALEADIVSFAAGAAGAAVNAAMRLKAKAIVTLGGSGLTALLVSKWKPTVPILAMSSHEGTLRRFNVLWGVVALPIPEGLDMEKQLEIADQFLVREGWAKPDQTTVVVGALPLSKRRQTNTIRFHRINGPLP
jgi:pyruvate kinase